MSILFKFTTSQFSREIHIFYYVPNSFYDVFQAAELKNPSWIELHESRGTEDYFHKIFMRNSVLVSDILILAPSVLAFTRNFPEHIWTLSAFMLYPGLILIDNGHFQYNDISLGLLTLAVAFILRDRELCASVAFVLALNYKQMELYHALPFFFYLLGKSFKNEQNWFTSLFKLVKIGLTVISTFGLIWWPFRDQALQVLNRIFPGIWYKIGEIETSNPKIHKFAMICFAFSFQSIAAFLKTKWPISGAPSILYSS